MALTLALGLYLLWVFVTYLLEGRIHTFQRPEAIGARLIYALVANIVIGIGGSALVIRSLSAHAPEVGSRGFFSHDGSHPCISLSQDGHITA
jgi:hypothetical protein